MVPIDLLPVSVAAAKVGLTGAGVTYWIETGRVREYGRGKRRARLVSMAEVRAEAHASDSTVPMAEAARIIGVEPLKIVAFCASGFLPHARTPGGVYLIDRISVQREARRRARFRERHLSLKQAVAVSGLPRWALLEFASEGELTLTPGPRAGKYVKKRELRRLVARLAAAPSPCPQCGLPLPARRKVHKGACAGKAGATYSAAGSKALTAAGVRRRDAYEKYKAENGLVDIHDLAKELRRSYRSIWRIAEGLGRGQRHPRARAPEGVLLFDAIDVARIRRAVKESHVAELYADPKRDGDWYLARFGSKAGYGRRAGELAARKSRPKRIGRPPEILVDEKKIRILKLLAQPHMGRKRSQQHVADLAGVSRGSVRHVAATWTLTPEGVLQKKKTG